MLLSLVDQSYKVTCELAVVGKTGWYTYVPLPFSTRLIPVKLPLLSGRTNSLKPLIWTNLA